MLWHYAENMDWETDAGKDSQLSFQDADQAASWARSALQWAYSSGILQGDDKGLLNPAAPIDRAEAAAALERFIRLTIEQQFL